MVDVHANKRCRVAQVDGSGGGANVGYQLPREPSIALPEISPLRPAKLEIALSAALCGAPALQIMTEAVECTQHQPRWSPHALSNSADATSAVSFGQAMASSNATDPTNPLRG
jgi:hypothetical protein